MSHAARRRAMSLSASHALPWPIWVWYEYPSAKPARYIQLNLEALRRHAPPSHFVIRFVNRSNVATYVPDLPDAFWRLPTQVAFSDAARLALLASKGGLYIDADFLILRSLLPVAELLRTVDIVGYPASPPHGHAETSAKCAASGKLSANFLAARPEVALFRRAWDHFRLVLPRKCSDMRKRKIYICCRKQNTGELLDKCNVPHATTDLMLQRARLALAGSDAPKGGSKGNATIHCFGGVDDLTTPRLEPEMMPPPPPSLQTNPIRKKRFAGAPSLLQILGISLIDMRLCYGKWRLMSRKLGCDICSETSPSDRRLEVCCSRDGDDLVCRNKLNGRGHARSAGFFGRHRLGYHQFDSFQRSQFLKQEQIEWSNLTVAPLYRRALGLTSE